MADDHQYATVCTVHGQAWPCDGAHPAADAEITPTRRADR